MNKINEEIRKVEEEIENEILSCSYNKRKQDKNHECSDCRDEIDLLKTELQTLQECKKMFEDVVEKLKNPYPEDIFPKLNLSEFQTHIINDFLLSNLRFSFNKLSAEIMRRARENVKQELLKEVLGEGK